MPCSIGREPWDNDMVAFFSRLQARMTDRWARDGITWEQASEIELSLADLQHIAGKGRWDAALALARRCADVTSMSVEHRPDIGPTSGRCRGDVVAIKWPKWAKLQEGHSRSPGSGRAVAGAPLLFSSAPQEEKIKRRAPRATRRPKTECPDELDTAGFERVREWVATVLPRQVERVDAMVEQALGYYRREGKRFADWPQAVIDNIRALENAQRKRDGDPPVRSVAEARWLQAEIAKRKHAMEQEELPV